MIALILAFDFCLTLTWEFARLSDKSSGWKSSAAASHPSILLRWFQHKSNILIKAETSKLLKINSISKGSPHLYAALLLSHSSCPFFSDTFTLPFTPTMFDIDGGWRWAIVWWKREASIRSRAETLIRMRVPMPSLRRWNQTGRGQCFPSFTMRRKGKLFSPFFPPFWSVWLQTDRAHTPEMQLLIFSVSPHLPAPPPPSVSALTSQSTAGAQVSP